MARLFPSGGEDEREQRLAVLLEAEFAGSGPLMSAQFRSRVQVRCTGHVFLTGHVFPQRSSSCTPNESLPHAPDLGEPHDRASGAARTHRQHSDES